MRLEGGISLEALWDKVGFAGPVRIPAVEADCMVEHSWSAIDAPIRSSLLR